MSFEVARRASRARSSFALSDVDKLARDQPPKRPGQPLSHQRSHRTVKALISPIERPSCFAHLDAEVLSAPGRLQRAGELATGDVNAVWLT